MQEVASLGGPLFALFEHPAPRMLDGVALMMRAVAEGGVLAAAPMREAALADGALLTHLLLAVTQQVRFPGPTYESQDLQCIATTQAYASKQYWGLQCIAMVEVTSSNCKNLHCTGN